MKMTIQLFIALSLSCSLIFLGGCAKKTLTPHGSVSSDNMPEGTSIEYPPPESGIIGEDMGPVDENLDATGTNGSLAADQNSDEYKKLHGRSSPEMMPVYFDFDSAAIRSDQTGRLEQNGDYLKGSPAVNIVIEGNCDERGTNEYNLALGERRAINAQNYLIQLGVESHRIRTISYGEERPLFMEQDEFSWSQNRRDDFLVE